MKFGFVSFGGLPEFDPLKEEIYKTFTTTTIMETGAQIKSLLQTQLASDLSAVKYLPYCLDTLTQDDFLPSSHLTKWTTRINSLMHSKEPGARWAGLCLAYKTSLLSQSIMIQSAQSWLPTIISMLSVRNLSTSLSSCPHIFSIRETKHYQP